MGSERFGIAIAESLGHAVDEDALGVADSGDDARDDVVEEIEGGIGSEGAVVAAGPEARAGGGVDELSCDADFGAGLADAAFQHIAGAEFFGDGADVHSLLRVAGGGTASHDSEVGELRHAGDDVVGEAVGESGEVGTAAAEFEGKDGDPEAFVFANGGVRGAGARRGGGACRSRGDGRLCLARGRACAGGARHVAKFIGDVAGGLQAVARIFFEAAADDAREIAGKVGARVGDGGRIVAQDRGS